MHSQSAAALMLRHRLLSALLCCLACACGTFQRTSSLARFEFEQPQMGVPFRIVLYAVSETQAETAAKAAFQRIEHLNQILSDYETDSELNELSRTSGSGTAVKLSSDLWNVLSAAQRLAYDSGGAFDVTVGPCVTLWRRARREQRLPDPARLERAKARVGYTNLVLDPSKRTATLLVPNMHLDLGGIAKGYAADEAIKTLTQHGITRALVAASGDITVSGPPPGKKGWRIEIAGYDHPGGPQGQLLELHNAALATSGDVFQRLEIDGVRYSHIMDPFTCVGLTNHSLVTVVAHTGIQADALATTLCILPPDRGTRLAKSKAIAYRIVQETTDGLLVRSAGMRPLAAE